ncbi:MAG: ATP-binding protein, partial [Candidatus Margulisbacteria bacterium]|nr:ATP-binding protein [Candidatus Margulisiibacteriota bacterium]
MGIKNVCANDAIMRSKLGRTLELAFAAMCRSRMFVVREKKAYLLFEVFSKPSSEKSFAQSVYEKGGWAEKLKDLGLSDSNRSQVFDVIKNAVAYGGDALITACRYQAVKRGVATRVFEFVVWDNGAGIKNILEALKQGHTSWPGLTGTDIGGQGLGLDRILVKQSFNVFMADEIIVESGNNKVSRFHRCDAYHHNQLATAVKGTRVTLRFWEEPQRS